MAKRRGKEEAELSGEKVFFDPAWLEKGIGYRVVKRAFDVVAAFLALILFSPLILILLLLVWLQDFHNPVYVSERIGKGGKPFRFYKIRTMIPGAEEMKETLIEEGLNEADGPAFKMTDDPRVTKLGRIYRKFSLDELLQFINIINGTMSFVGPRPPIPCEVKRYTEEQMHRLDVKGGLLCLWQVQRDRNSIPFDRWVELDMEYIKKRSLWFDLKIMLTGAYMVVFDHSGV